MRHQQKHCRHPLFWSHLYRLEYNEENFVVIVISKSAFTAKSDKVFWALIIGSVFTVSFDLSQGVMCDSAVISNLNIKGKFNVNLISSALKN